MSHMTAKSSSYKTAQTYQLLRSYVNMQNLFPYGVSPPSTWCVGNIAASNVEKQNTDPLTVFN